MFLVIPVLYLQKALLGLYPTMRKLGPGVDARKGRKEDVTGIRDMYLY